MRSFPVLLVRHAPVQVAQGICYGRQDVALSPGWESIVSGLSVLAKGAVCQVLYSSPAQRCWQMAQRLAQSAGMELRVDHRLAELNFGRWEGVRWQDIDRTLLDEWAQNPEGFAPPEGESGQDLYQRIQSFWREVRQREENVCVLSHGGPLRLLSAFAGGYKPHLLAPSMPQGFARLFMVGEKNELASNQRDFLTHHKKEEPCQV
ncbi:MULTISPECIES: histidine phosphatase family protein [Acetobacter]|uniref:Phosphoglycerate mutase n=2 Tax=Acetobacter TaxID=434 RepID=A0AAN1PG47_9PROT|nr:MULTISPECIES: histidine phosphatase family protein [Acetobacter]ASL41068.1 phosphoglycerate mutase [Acetobacter oryzifermentans]AXM99608.1 phosphoglycerate mutase [Acetobacter pomorum]KAA8394224.1 phosphoglycerate mutase [Acetobacter sp. DmW_125127]KAA8395962.1 phosphoglycerate mutase [Acetobacter sp. DmW_125124]KAA8399765.1 phosphoglycerate mutase [Acetobacter sp. DmW_125128]